MHIARRSMFRFLPALAGVAIYTKSEGKESIRVGGPYGYMDPERWLREGFDRIGCRIEINGLDVTDDCQDFDDVEGWANIWRPEWQGGTWTRRDRHVERMWGNIVVVRPTRS